MEGNDRIAFPVFEPEVSRNLPVVLVGLAIPARPLIELGPSDSQPTGEGLGWDLRLLDPIVNEIDDLISNAMGNPAACQSSPSSFFTLTYSSEISAMTESLRLSFSSRVSTLS